MITKYNVAKHKISARAPAKLIISGEHAVLYNQTALAVAINRYTTTSTSWHVDEKIHFSLANLRFAKSYTLKALRKIANSLRNDYQSFLQGKHSIRAVLKKPFDLLQYSVATILDLVNVHLPNGLTIAVDSNIPIGCGMGSSAAAVISSIYSLSHFLDFGFAGNEILVFGQQIESLQHGRSSGLDLHPVMYGGSVLFDHGTVKSGPTPNFIMQVVNTGQATCSTGECVSKVASNFRNNDLAQRFAATTIAIADALNSNNYVAFKNGIKQNHQLLQEIGVVPGKVADFISDIEGINGAAKICGAGAINGDNGGIVLVLAENDITSIANKYGYNVQNIEIDRYGTRII